jgi:hypothetical protein
LPDPNGGRCCEVLDQEGPQLVAVHLLEALVGPDVVGIAAACRHFQRVVALGLHVLHRDRQFVTQDAEEGGAT